MKSPLVRFLLFVALITACMALIACELDLSQTTTQTYNPGGPSANPTPSPSTAPSTTPVPVARINVSEIARDAGCGVAPILLPSPCKVMVTCTPRDAADRDVGPLYIPAWSASGSLAVTPTTKESYNARVECDGTGPGFAVCEVGGKIGSYQLNCQ